MFAFKDSDEEVVSPKEKSPIPQNDRAEEEEEEEVPKFNFGKVTESPRKLDKT